MKITKSELQKIIKEALLQEMTPAPGGSRFRDPRLRSGDRADTEKLQTMLYRLEDDFLPFLMNTEEVEIGEAANQLYKHLKARVEG